MEAVPWATPDNLPVSRELWREEQSSLDTHMVVTMSMGERLYTGNGSGIIAHSILRKRSPSRLNGSPGRNISSGRHKSPSRQLQSSSSSLSSSSIYSTSFASSPISRSTPHLPSSSSPSHKLQRRLPKTPNKRLKLALDKFSNIALPFYLQIIVCHTSNISKVSDFKALKEN